MNATQPTSTKPEPLSGLAALQASSTLINTLRRMSLANERPGHVHYLSKADVCGLAADLERLALQLHEVHAARHQAEARAEADAAFAVALDRGMLSRSPTAPNYVGHYMHMGRVNGCDAFKHRDTREYIYLTS